MEKTERENDLLGNKDARDLMIEKLREVAALGVTGMFTLPLSSNNSGLWSQCSSFSVIWG